MGIIDIHQKKEDVGRPPARSLGDQLEMDFAKVRMQSVIKLAARLKNTWKFDKHTMLLARPDYCQMILTIDLQPRVAAPSGPMMSPSGPQSSEQESQGE